MELINSVLAVVLGAGFLLVWLRLGAFITGLSIRLAHDDDTIGKYNDQAYLFVSSLFWPIPALGALIIWGVPRLFDALEASAGKTAGWFPRAQMRAYKRGLTGNQTVVHVSDGAPSPPPLPPPLLVTLGSKWQSPLTHTNYEVVGASVDGLLVTLRSDHGKLQITPYTLTHDWKPVAG